ncbi:MAG: hypothetical protein WBO09_15775 [Methylocystis silviterrae]
MIQLDLDEISPHVEKAAHAALLLDRAGWHTTAKLIMPKTSRRSNCRSHARAQPGRERLAVSASELALQPRLQELRRYLNAACQAWRKLTDQPKTIVSIGMRDWAHIG